MNEGFHPPLPPDPHHITIEGASLAKVLGKDGFPLPPQITKGVPALAEQIYNIEDKIKIAFKDYVDHAGEVGGEMRTEELLRLHKELAKLQEKTL